MNSLEEKIEREFKEGLRMVGASPAEASAAAAIHIVASRDKAPPDPGENQGRAND